MKSLAQHLYARRVPGLLSLPLTTLLVLSVFILGETLSSQWPLLLLLTDAALRAPKSLSP